MKTKHWASKREKTPHKILLNVLDLVMFNKSTFISDSGEREISKNNFHFIFAVVHQIWTNFLFLARLWGLGSSGERKKFPGDNRALFLEIFLHTTHFPFYFKTIQGNLLWLVCGVLYCCHNWMLLCFYMHLACIHRTFIRLLATPDLHPF